MFRLKINIREIEKSKSGKENPVDIANIGHNTQNEDKQNKTQHNTLR